MVALQNTEKPVITASRIALDNRVLNADGLRFENQPDGLDLYDGALYGGTIRNYKNWFTLEKPSIVLHNQELSVCDIDTPQDLLNHFSIK